MIPELIKDCYDLSLINEHPEVTRFMFGILHGIAAGMILMSTKGCEKLVNAFQAEPEAEAAAALAGIQDEVAWSPQPILEIGKDLHDLVERALSVIGKSPSEITSPREHSQIGSSFA